MWKCTAFESLKEPPKDMFILFIEPIYFLRFPPVLVVRILNLEDFLLLFLGYVIYGWISKEYSYILTDKPEKRFNNENNKI